MGKSHPLTFMFSEELAGTVSREVFDHHGRGRPLAKPSSHPKGGEGTGQKCLREPLGCFATPAP